MAAASPQPQSWFSNAADQQARQQKPTSAVDACWEGAEDWEEQQLCRWLLLGHDRVKGDELIMTQELIADMLGVRR